jgi:hypothetical protein
MEYLEIAKAVGQEGFLLFFAIFSLLRLEKILNKNLILMEQLASKMGVTLDEPK